MALPCLGRMRRTRVKLKGVRLYVDACSWRYRTTRKAGECLGRPTRPSAKLATLVWAKRNGRNTRTFFVSCVAKGVSAEAIDLRFGPKQSSKTRQATTVSCMCLLKRGATFGVRCVAAKRRAHP